MTTVLIAVDGSDLDRTLVSSATGLFGDTADYVIVNVADDAIEFATVSVAHGIASAVSQPALSRFGDGLQLEAEQAEEVASRVAATIEAHKVTAVGEVGDPISVILRAADDHDADVIVVGTRDRSWFSRLFDPSVSHNVTELASRPVLVVHADH